MNSLIFRIFWCVFVVLPAMPQAHAQFPDLYSMDRRNVTICPAAAAETTPPDFTHASCRKGYASDVDPQGTMLWFRTVINLPDTQGANGEPLSLYVSGKMASEVYLNGQFVGRNGMPGISAETEAPGLMDAELFVPQDLLRKGVNEIVVKASAHHGYITLGWPLHIIALGPSGIHANGLLPRYIPALVTLGLFVVGALYFGTMAAISTDRMRFIILGAICFFAGAQLVSEALRGLVAYPYPVHDLRLIGIALFSTGFGLSVAFHIFRVYARAWAIKAMVLLFTVSAVMVFFTPSYDFKAIIGMSLPLAAALVASAYWSYRGRRRALLYFVIVLVFLASIFIFQGLFLDTFFFFLVAFFLLLIFIEQAVTLAEEARERRSEQARADRLSAVLADVQERSTASVLSVKSAGKLERIATRDIVHCSSADGYAEIVLTDGRTLLYSAPLNDMEDELPATFLRVHRSHLINVKYVEALHRDASGTGTLTLVGGAKVPVSRRIMPKVRQALA